MPRQLVIGLVLLVLGSVAGFASTFVAVVPHYVEKARSAEREKTSTCTADISTRDGVIALHRAAIKELEETNVRQRELTSRARVAATICSLQRKDMVRKIGDVRREGYQALTRMEENFDGEWHRREAIEQKLAETERENIALNAKVAALECDIARLKRQPGVCPLK